VERNNCSNRLDDNKTSLFRNTRTMVERRWVVSKSKNGPLCLKYSNKRAQGWKLVKWGRNTSTSVA